MKMNNAKEMKHLFYLNDGCYLALCPKEDWKRMQRIKETLVGLDFLGTETVIVIVIVTVIVKPNRQDSSLSSGRSFPYFLMKTLRLNVKH